MLNGIKLNAVVHEL